MASPGNILDIDFSLVGSIDSNYYGITILDSATSTLTLNNDNDLQKTFVTTSSYGLTVPSTYGQSLNGGGGGGSTTSERWY
tara:strand:+ start:2449 stop:2691 length:243 start_codon:yes stop_codon:yes gene_type:complete